MADVYIHQLVLFFGVLGNVVSFLVYLAPVPTFYRIYKKKSTEGFQSIPYAVALFSSMLYLYYAFLKKNETLLITINSVGLVIESIYLAMYLIYAPKKSKVYTAMILLFCNAGAYSLIIIFTLLLSNGSQRIAIVGWICVVFSVAVFAAPLSIMRLVMKTKSVEYMPFWLSFFLTLCAVMWFFYGFLRKDYFIATPSVLGFIFGIAQMILYAVYKGNEQATSLEPRQDGLKQEAEISVVIEIQENFNNDDDAIKKAEDVEKIEEKNNVEIELDESNM